MSQSPSATRNVFILGLTAFQRGELGTVRGADRYAFHRLLDYETLTSIDTYDFDELADMARAELESFGGPVDAIIAHWDFPTSVLAPLVAKEWGIPAPSLDSVLRCEHKYWSRLEQSASIPECVPGFSAFDPFGPDPRGQIDLDFPFWVKPVKAHSSMLGFAVHDKAELDDAVRAIREGIGPIARSFDQALAHVELPDHIRDAPGSTCLAEELVAGIQAAPEGTMFRGTFSVHGMFDMLREVKGNSFSRFGYPAGTVPDEVQDRMVDAAERYLRHVGFDDGCFNVEYMWDEDTDELWLIEVNTRISQSHSDLFAKVDGVSNHEAAIDIALGNEPSMPHRQGPFGVAAKCHLRHEGDGVVRRVPSGDELAALVERFPETHVELKVAVGDRLGDLDAQDTYTFELATFYLGATDRRALDHAYETCTAELRSRFEIDPTSD